MEEAPLITTEIAPARKHRTFNLIWLPLVFFLGVGVGYLLRGSNIVGGSASKAAVTPPVAENQGQPAAQTTPRKVTRYDVPDDNDPALGPANAPITIIEFSDYECPFCARWQAEVLPRLQEAYPNQVRLVYRDFPLTSIHGDALSAAEAANCAGEQGAYWKYHDKLFAAENGLGKDALLKYANDLGLDSPAFESCLNSEKYKDEVEGDLNFATELGVRSTPTFFINGLAIVGAQPFEVFQGVIDKELAGEIPK
jgi:protein-disulfide isomerase